jgi:hypothetical protein
VAVVRSLYRDGVQRLLASMGETDCEAFDAGWLVQPVNALSSLAFTVVGIAMVGWVRAASGPERLVRWGFIVGMVATGIGSFLYHGPQTSGSQFSHDITFLVTVVILAIANLGAGLRWSPSTVWTVIAVLSFATVVALVISPGVTNVITGVVVLLLVMGDLSVRRAGTVSRPWFVGALTTLGLALAFLVLGRTGNLLCDPESALQGHGMWHVLGAVSLGTYAVATGYARVGRRA